MSPKGGPTLFPCDYMSFWLHGIIMIQPNAGSAAKSALFASEHGAASSANLDSIVLSHASASRDSSVLWKSGGCVLKKS
jgi:hypothetical protein